MNPVLVLVPVTVVGALVCGLVLTLVDSIRQPLALRLGSERVLGWLSGIHYLGLMAGLLLGGMLVDRLGVESGLIVGSLLAAVGLSLLALRESYPSTLSTLLVIGLATGFLLTGAATLMTVAFFPGYPAAAISLGWILVSLARVLTPRIVAVLLEQLRLRRSLLLLALTSLLPALAAALTPGDEFPPVRAGETQLLFRQPILWLSSLVFFLYAPVEAGLSTWASIHLTELGFRERAARWLLAGCWIAFFAARLGTAFWIGSGGLPASSHPWIILGLGLLVGVALGNLAGTAYRRSAAWGLLLVGFFCGPLFPITAGLLLGHFREEPATAFGTMYALGTLSHLLLLPLMSGSARKGGVQRAMRIPLVSSLLLAAVALVLALTW